MINFPKNHPDLQQFKRLFAFPYVSRTYGSILVGLSGAFGAYEAHPFISTLILIMGFTWTHFWYEIAKQTKKLVELMSIINILEGLIYGWLAFVLNFQMIPTLAFFVGGAINWIGSRGLPSLFLGYGFWFFGGYLGYLQFGFNYQPEANFYATVFGAIYLATVPPAIMLMAYNTNKLVNDKRRELEAAKREVEEKTHQLEELATKLAKYLSPQVYDSIFSGEKKVKIETYLKPLTVFFSDIAGFTSTSEKLSPEELTQWLNAYLDDMADVAIRYNGTLDKFIGDAVMVFFGDPQSHGEQMDALKCVLMAMEMRARAKLMGMSIRIGVNSGNCIVGNFGSEERMDYTIIGGSVNLAARLESNSSPGKILISDTTYELIKAYIDCDLRGKIRVKGIDREIITYWVREYKRSFFTNQ